MEKASMWIRPACVSGTNRCSRSLAFGLALLTLLPASIRAQGTSFTIPSSTATGIGLASAANYQVAHDAQWKDYEDVVILSALNGTAKASANAGQPLAASDYNSVVTQLQNWLTAQQPQHPVFVNATACLHYTIDALITLLNSSQSVNPYLKTALAGLENLNLTQVASPLDLDLQGVGQGYVGFANLPSNGYQFIAQQVRDSSDLAQNDSTFATAVSPILKDLLTVDSTASYAQIQALYQNALPVLPTPNSDGSYTLDFELDVMVPYQSAVQGMVTAIQNQVSTLGTATTPTCSAAPVTLLSDQCTPQADPANNVLGAVTGWSALASFPAPTTGIAIGEVGSSVIEIAKTIGQVAEAVGEASKVFGSVGKVLGGIGILGGLVGGGLELYAGLFGGGDSDDAPVLSAIQDLSKQLQDVQTDMNDQFEEVDDGLIAIVGQLNQNFHEINYNLGVLNANLQAVQSGLLEVQTDVNQLAQFVIQFAQAQDYEALEHNMGCLNYTQTSGSSDITQTTFANCAEGLYQWAYYDAPNAIWAPTGGDYSDHGVYNFLLDTTVSGQSGLSSPFSTAVNYLAQYPAAQLGVPGLAPATLPLANPQMWVLASQAYLELLQQWPQYAAKIGSDNLNNLIIEGQSLQQAIHNANSSGTGAGFAANPNLFNALVGKYNTAISNLNADLQKYENTYVAKLGVIPSNSSTALNVNLFAGGANQTTSWRPNQPSTLDYCNGAALGLTTPYPYAGFNIFSYVPGLYAFSQAFLEGGKLSACIDHISWSNYRTGPPANGDNCVVGGVEFGPFPPTYVYELAVGSAPPWDNAYFSVTNCGFAALNVVIDVQFTPNNAGVQSAATLASLTYSRDVVSELEYKYCGFWLYGCWSWDSGTYGPVDAAGFAKANWPKPVYLGSYWGWQGIDIPDDWGYWKSAAIAQPSLYNATVAAADNYAVTNQQNMYNNIAQQVSQVSPIGTDGQLLTGFKTLIQAYTSFGLPGFVQTDDVLHGLLFSNPATHGAPILEGTDVQNAFSAAAAGVTAQTDTVDQIGNENTLLTNRSAALSAELAAVFQQIQQNGVPDSLDAVDSTVADLQAFLTIKNAGALTPCTYQLSQNSASFDAGGGSITITVTSASGCSLNALTGANWLHVTSTPGSSPGQFQVTVTATGNPNAAQAAVVLIGDQLFRVLGSTATAACGYALGSSSLMVGATQGSWPVSVATGAGCTWAAVSEAPSWLSVPTGAGGAGSGSVTFSVAANTTPLSRTGVISIAGLQFTVSQVNACDIAVAGQNTVLDVQRMVEEVIGVMPATDNPSRSGKANMTDVQMTVNAALGMGCSGNGS